MYQLGSLYHWSPRSVRKQIDRHGLRPSQKSASVLILGDEDEFRQPAICFSLSPATAWNYSHDVFGTHGTFDLWEVEPERGDEVHVLPSWGGRIAEVRIPTPIVRSRLVWVGERVVPSPLEVLETGVMPPGYSKRLRAEVRALRRERAE